MSDYDVVIVGGGPAGLAAALYTGRMDLKTVVVDRGAFGGQLLNTELIEDYPGFESILGSEDRFEARIVLDQLCVQELTAKRTAVDHHRLQVHPSGVQCGRQPGGTPSDDDDVVIAHCTDWNCAGSSSYSVALA